MDQTQKLVFSGVDTECGYASITATSSSVNNRDQQTQIPRGHINTIKEFFCQILIINVMFSSVILIFDYLI